MNKAELIAQQVSAGIKVQKIWGDIILNVKDSPYNAIGDGVKDDTVAIQKAINYAISIGKSDIWMPPGLYKYTTLTNTANITFYGDGVTLNGTTVLHVVSFHSFDTRIDNIVASAGSSNTEIVDARLPSSGSAYPTLKDRLDTEHAVNVASINNEQAARIAADNNEQAARIAADAAHEADTTAHNATAIVFTPGGSGISATNVDGAIKEMDTLLDALQSGDSSAAANAARVSTPYGITYPTLKDRVDHTDTEVIALKADTTQRAINAKYPPSPLVAAVGGGVTDETTIIQNLLNASNVTILYIPDGTYNISAPIIIPANKTLRMSKNATINLTTNTDVFGINDGVRIEGGYIKCKTVPGGFTKSVIFFGSNTKMGNVIIDGLYADNYVASSNVGSGIGFNFDSTAYPVSSLTFSRFTNFYLIGFAKGINVKQGDNIVQYVNANFFSGTCSYCLNAVYCTGDGNTFQIIGEATDTTNNESAVYINGLNNTISGIIFDIGNTGKSTVAYELYGYGNTLISEVSDKYIIDHSGGKNITSQMMLISPPPKGSPTFGTRGQRFNGVQDNYLAAADKRFTVSDTFTNVSLYDSVNYPTKQAFKANSPFYAIYRFANPASTTDNVQVTIDCAVSKSSTLMGIVFHPSQYPKHVKFEAYSTNDSAWHSKDIYPDLSTGGGFFVWNMEPELSFNVYSNISKYRYTIYQPNTGTDVSVYSFFASCRDGVFGLLPTEGGSIYGDITMQSGASIKTPGQNGINVTVGNGATTLIVSGLTQFDGNYSVFVTPGWNTTWWVPAAEKFTTQFKIYFGTAPSGANTLDWGIRR